MEKVTILKTFFVFISFYNIPFLPFPTQNKEYQQKTLHLRCKVLYLQISLRL